MNKVQSGFTIIEILVTIFIIGTVIVGLFGLFVLSMRLTQESERRVVAVSLANERAEMIRNLPYASVGTAGGIPSGAIAQSETITRNNTPYQVTTDIRYVDDPYDGTATGNPPDLVNTDYKQARVQVSWSTQVGTRPVLLLLTVAPPGIEGGEAAGTLIFHAIDANAAPVAQATVMLDNAAVSPAVHITTYTDDAGMVVLPGLPASNLKYVLTVTKNGYTSEQTLAQTTSFFPDAAHTHLTAIAGQITNKTFVIDHTATLNVHTQNPEPSPLGSLTYHLKGTKSNGLDAEQKPVLLVDSEATTNASGVSAQTPLAWDAYDVTVDGAATGYDIKETSAILPVTLNPGNNLDLTVNLVPHVPISLQASVISPTNQPVDNATVTLSGGSYSRALGTGAWGQVFFDDVPASGDYTLLVDAPNYTSLSQTVSVAATTRTKVQLTPAGP